MQITYNLLNLPQVISRGNVAQARYIYTADSIKCETTGNADSGYAYLGSLIFNKNAAGYAFESAQFGGGRIIHTTGTIAPAYYTTDHLGSVRMITDANGTIQEQNDYYPFGGRHTSGNTYAALPGNNFKFNGKEEQTTGATGYLDYGARMYDNVTGRWGTPDPLAEKYKSLSPYNYCLNNPMKFIDPDGKEVVIAGKLSAGALQQLQTKVGNSITLSMNNAGKVSYMVNTDKKVKGDAKRMAEMIDNNSIIVNLLTTDKNETSTGNLMIGGAFMGNTVIEDADGNTIIIANQEINPNVLGSADSHTETPGKMIMHEITEAYAGAQISQKRGVGVGAATQTQTTNPQSVYNRAHNQATPQTPVYQTLYDNRGQATTDAKQAVRVEWSVIKNGKSKVIQTYP